MSQLLWRSPGPARFLREFQSSISNGKSVIVSTPVQHPAAMASRFRDLVRGSYDWLELKDFEESVVKSIAMVLPCCFESRMYSLSYFKTVAREFAGKCFFIDCRNSSPSTWLEVTEFVDAFLAINKVIADLERSVIIVMSPHYAFLDSVRTDVNLSSLVWRNYTSPKDIQYILEMSDLLNREYSIEGELRNTIIAHLCSWDESMLNEIGHLEFREVFHPESILEEFAIRRKWNDLCDDSLNSLLIAGVLQLVNNDYHTHTAFAYLKGDRSMIQKRIWSAEIRVLFPYIEVMRSRIIERYGFLLNKPFRNQNNRELISDVKELEIGSLSYLLCKKSIGSVPRKVVDFCVWLRDIRNSLAHGQVVEPNMLKQFIDKEPL